MQHARCSCREKGEAPFNAEHSAAKKERARAHTCSTTRAMPLGATQRGFFWMAAPVLGSSSARSLATTTG
jgi:hypothetical protein